MRLLAILNRIPLTVFLICLAVTCIWPAARASASTIVTFTLSINDDGFGNDAQGQFAVFAGDSLDNGGIAGLGITLGGNWISDVVIAPWAGYPDGPFGQPNILGFTAISSPNSNPVFIYQSEIFAPDGNIYGLPQFLTTTPVYGFGQAPGSLPPNPDQAVQPNYGAPLLVLQGTFDGPISLIGGDFANANTFVFVDTNSVNTESVSVEFTTQTLPEPTAGIFLLICGGILARMPKARGREPHGRQAGGRFKSKCPGSADGRRQVIGGGIRHGHLMTGQIDARGGKC